MPVSKPDIFSYIRYRSFLEDAYWASKEADSRYSYRYFANEAGYRSPSFLLQIINGDKNLTAKGVDGLARAFELKDGERRFFGALVDFDQASSLAQRNDAFGRMCGSRRFRRHQNLEETWFEALSTWQMAALREMVRLPGFSDDPAWASERLSPSVSQGEVSQALEVLTRAGLLGRDAEGRLEPADGGRAPAGPLAALATERHHQQMTERAVDALGLYGPEARHMVSHTAILSKAAFTKFKTRLDDLLAEFVQASVDDPSPDAVYQLHAAAFPLSVAPKD